MANVFVSYARDDRARIQPLVGALEAEGLSVWWDPALIPGRRFRQMIAHELSTADSVLVIWTRQALESDWVQDEAEEARERGVLIPIIMEPVTPPAGFRQLQAADLTQWTGQSAHPEFKALIHACWSLVQWAEQERTKTRPLAEPPPAETVALIANPAMPAEPETEPVAVVEIALPPAPETDETEPAREVEPQPISRKPTTRSTRKAKVDAPPAFSASMDTELFESELNPTPPTLPPLPEKVSEPSFGEKMVRAFAAPRFGWFLGAAMLLLGVSAGVAVDDEGGRIAVLATAALSAPIAMGFSGIILRRGLKRRAILATQIGAGAGVVLFLLALFGSKPDTGAGMLLVIVATGVAVVVAGYALGAAVGALISPKPSGVAAEPANPSPSIAVNPLGAVPETPKPPGFVTALLMFLSDRHIKWWIAGVGGLCGVIFFFSQDSGQAGLVVGVTALLSLPAAAIATRMLDRGLPRGPVISAMAGGALAGLYALMLAMAALSFGPMGVFGAVAAVTIFPLFGFVIFGGVAVLLTSGSKTPPAVGRGRKA